MHIVGSDAETIFKHFMHHKTKPVSLEAIVEYLIVIIGLELVTFNSSCTIESAPTHLSHTFGRSMSSYKPYCLSPTGALHRDKGIIVQAAEFSFLFIEQDQVKECVKYDVS